MLKIIIAGSRNFNNYSLMKKRTEDMLQYLLNEGKIASNEDVEIVSGGARGADKLGEKFADEHDIELLVVEADWDKHGKSAGYKRNEKMAKYANKSGILLAFWDGKSKGTKHMIDIAKRYGLKVYVINI